ncbi:hypothetical protein ACLJJ6_02115 [Pediococcus siamensis]
MAKEFPLYGRMVKQTTNVLSRRLDAFAARFGLTGVSVVDDRFFGA